MASLAEASRLLRKMTNKGFCGLWCRRAMPLLLSEELPVEVLIVLTVGARELRERVLMDDMTEGVARDEREGSMGL